MAAYINPTPILDPPTAPNVVNADINTETDLAESSYSTKDSVFFAFIDILGFKRAFDYSQESANNFAIRCKDVFTYYFSLMEAAEFMTSSSCYAGQTSDSLYFYTDRSDHLIQFLIIFSHLNVYAMSQDVFLRGGVAKGNLFSRQGHQFYGESVIKAYLLESEISKDPIIVIDENTNEELKTYTEYPQLIAKNKFRYYVKPFAYLEHNLYLNINKENKNIEKPIKCKAILETIKKNISLFEYDSRNYGKYHFLYNEYSTMLCNKIGGQDNGK